MWMDIPYEDDMEEYKEFPENFGSSLVGISKADFEALNESSEQPVDEEDFLSGKKCLVYHSGVEFPENFGSSLVGIRYLTVEIMHSF